MAAAYDYPKLVREAFSLKARDKKMYIMRGAPGSGKTSLWKVLGHHDWTTVASADDYFVNFYGEYEWNPRELPDAHDYCKEVAKAMCEFPKTLTKCAVVIDNCNVKPEHAEFYIDLAIEHGFTPYVIDVGDAGLSAEELHQRTVDNGHNVPVHTLRRIKRELKDYRLAFAADPRINYVRV